MGFDLPQCGLALPTTKSYEIKLNFDRAGDGGCQNPTRDKRQARISIGAAG